MHCTTPNWARVAFLLLCLSLPTTLALSVERRATTCNGHAELCNRSYGNVTFVGAHNSYAVGTNNLATNQDYDVTQQLNDGIRMLQMQAHQSTDAIHLCHTSCLLYEGGTLAAYLAKVKTWMDSNPNDVVTLLIVNSDNLAPSAFDSVFQSAGLVSLSYTPPSAVVPASQWPTLGSMIDAGKRLVTFLDANANFDSVPYIIDEFTNIWETAFDVTDPTFDCNVNRTKGDTNTQMYLINHFLDEVVNVVATSIAPDKGQLNVTNAESGPGSLGDQADRCGAQNGRYPNFMLVDFYEFGGGSVFKVGADLNGVTYSPTSPIATPLPDSTSSGSSTGKGSGALPSLHVSSTHFGALMALLSGTVIGALALF
ncbi:PLC-like phosphodiesterase [Rickenella mellea]|uniref:PLC-like phosphodiesterase n=1 Tax=Rickenella mellea TaxID=50990 RepID=A0A4Y7QKQ7_9AGAM|nr:PLC-like phosphodiesterase [Rickenella mellea]